MTNAGIRLRVSTSAQDEASQEPQVHAWVAQHGYTVAEEYRVHGMSAYHGRHEPELRRAMADMKAGRIEVLVVWKSDRIDRQEKLGALIKEAQGYGGRIEFVTEPELNALSGLGGRMMTVVKEFMNAEESRTKSDRTMIKQAALRSSGSFVGKAPYGLRIEALTNRAGASFKTLFPIHDEARVVARIFDEAANAVSLAQVARNLHADEFRISAPGRGKPR
jgi:DNA invertase Pin-like site-specific DNA recombinase